MAPAGHHSGPMIPVRTAIKGPLPFVTIQKFPDAKVLFPVLPCSLLRGYSQVV